LHNAHPLSRRGEGEGEGIQVCSRITSSDICHELENDNIHTDAILPDQTVPSRMSSIREQIESFGTWITRFDFEGVESGGTYDPTNDQRVGRFVTELRTFTAQSSNADCPLRILECGSFEGAQTAMLAQAFPHAQITAVEVR
jgi:hypothetical protein